MKLQGNVDKLVKFIKDHRLGGGDFHVVTLDGKEFQIPGVKKDSESGASSHFTDLGQGAGIRIYACAYCSAVCGCNFFFPSLGGNLCVGRQVSKRPMQGGWCR